MFYRTEQVLWTFVVTLTVSFLPIVHSYINDDFYTDSELKELCKFINKTDFRIKNIYHLLPKRGGDRLLKQLHFYNDTFSKLTNYIVSNNSVEQKECRYVLKPGAARFFYAPYDDELLKYFFKWTPPYTKNKGKYEDMLDFRVDTLHLWNKLHDFLGLDYFDFYYVA